MKRVTTNASRTLLITIFIGLLSLTVIMVALLETTTNAAALAGTMSLPLSASATTPPPLPVDIGEAGAPPGGAFVGSPTTPPPPGSTPVPIPVPTPTPTPSVTTITQIFHILRFPAESIFEALNSVFQNTLQEEGDKIESEVGQWSQVFSEAFKAPASDQYSKVARDSLPVAAALAVPLFLLRLAIYHWNRLTGENDTPLRAIGDWITAGIMAVAAGPVLDLMVQAGYWMEKQIILKSVASSGSLAEQFVNAMSISSILNRTVASFFSSTLSLGIVLGGLLALIAMLFAVVASTAALYVIAMLAPPVAVMGVIPQMSWLRSLLIKAATLLAVLPIVTGGVFVAGVKASSFAAGGLIDAVVHLFWLWGAAGLLMTMAGILGKITLGASAGALGKMVGGVKSVVGLAAAAGLAATGVGAAAAPAVAGAGAAGAGAAGAGAAGVGGTGAGAAGVGATSVGGAASAMGHLDAAEKFANQSVLYGALGLRTPAGMARGLAHAQQLAAQKTMLQERASNFTRSSSSTAMAPQSSMDIAHKSSGLDDFDRAFESFDSLVRQKGYHLGPLRDADPQGVGAAVRYYANHPVEVAKADNPLEAAVRGAGNEAIVLADLLDFKPKAS